MRIPSVREKARWLLRNRVTRMEVIQRCIDARRARTYLEIGVAGGDCFSSIRVPRKLGVDPVRASPQVLAEMTKPGVSYFQVTSDAFFRDVAPGELGGGVDVAFIDGLHTWRQAYRDCLNVLDHLAPGGIVLLHDCLPGNQFEARVADSYEEAATLNRAESANWDGAWTGDVWKAIVALRQDPKLETNVLACDYGIGVVRRGASPQVTRLSLEDIEQLGFEDLVRNPRSFLGLRRPMYLERLLR